MVPAFPNGPAILLTVSETHFSSSKSGRIFQLIEPIEPHGLDDTIADDNQPSIRLGISKMLVDGERGDVDKIAAFPFETLRLRVPIPGECIKAVEFEVPVKVIACALDNKNDFLSHMPVSAGALARGEKLHIGFHTALFSIELAMNEMLD